MKLAIDVGNTQTVFGLKNGDSDWITWRFPTDAETTEDQLAAQLKALFDLRSIEWKVDSAICASVVPSFNDAIALLCSKWFNVECKFLKHNPNLGLKVTYDPPTAVGADRLANALGALAKYQAPIIVVDFGTATTFDCIDQAGSYVGGAILPGVHISTQALVGRTAKLPQIEFKKPEHAIGKTTVESLQSGIVLGYAGAIDSLTKRIQEELGTASIAATGGLSTLFMGICESLQHHEPNLTLDGLLIALERS
jgi:type III pantothenate kinase